MATAQPNTQQAPPLMSRFPKPRTRTGEKHIIAHQQQSQSPKQHDRRHALPSQLQHLTTQRHPPETQSINYAITGTKPTCRRDSSTPNKPPQTPQVQIPALFQPQNLMSGSPPGTTHRQGNFNQSYLAGAKNSHNASEIHLLLSRRANNADWSGRLSTAANNQFPCADTITGPGTTHSASQNTALFPHMTSQCLICSRPFPR